MSYLRSTKVAEKRCQKSISYFFCLQYIFRKEHNQFSSGIFLFPEIAQDAQTWRGAEQIVGDLYNVIHTCAENNSAGTCRSVIPHLRLPS